jgi:hypothetical protein
MYNLAEAKLEIASIVRAVRFRPGRLFRLNETLAMGARLVQVRERHDELVDAVRSERQQSSP